MANQKKNPTRRILFILGGLILLLVIGGVVGKATGLFGKRENAVTVEVAPAAVRSLTQVVTASGKVQPEVEVKISPDVSGEIIFLGVQEGDWVEKGQPLVRIKPDFYAAQVEQARAGVSQALAGIAEAKAQLMKAEVDYKRQKELFDKNVVSETDLQTALTQFDIAKASFDAAQYRLESAKARERETQEQLSKTSIFAPMSGTVSQLNVEVGERVVGTTQMAGTEILRIARLDQMELLVDVNENDVVNVTVGDSAKIEVDAYPERAFKGLVTEIANSARVMGQNTQEQVTNFSVKIRVSDPHNQDARGAGPSGPVAQREVDLPVEGFVAQFRPGMSGTVDVYTQTAAGAVAVPIQAVTVRDMIKIREEQEEKEREKKGEKKAPKPDAAPEPNARPAEKKEDLRKVVFVLDNGKAKMVEVTTGISDDTHIQIKNGLTGKETVIVGPYRIVSRELMPDTPVQTEEETPAGRTAPVASAQ